MSDIEYAPINIDQTECEICLNTFLYTPKSQNTKTKCGACVSRLKRYDVKLRALAYKGNKCCICGYSRYMGALSFHHLRDKEFEISEAYSYSWDRIQKELDKTRVLCMNCHAEIHGNVIDIQD